MKLRFSTLMRQRSKFVSILLFSFGNQINLCLLFKIFRLLPKYFEIVITITVLIYILIAIKIICLFICNKIDLKYLNILI